MLQVLRESLTSICSDLPWYACRNVQTPDRVAILDGDLKDSYIESFHARDRPFVQQFIETQMFAEYCDSVIR